MPKKFQILPPFTFISQNDPVSIFVEYFLSFSSFLPFETAGMSPLPDTYLHLTGLTISFLIFFHYRHFKWRDWIEYLFFFLSVFCFFANICIFKTQIIMNKKLLIMIININLFEHIIHSVINYRLFIL